MTRSRVPYLLLGSLLLLSPLSAGRLEAGERAPAVDLVDLQGQEVHYAPPADAAKDAPVTIIFFLDPLQDRSVRGLEELRAWLRHEAGLAERVRALAIASGKLDDAARELLVERLPARDRLHPALDPERKAFRAFGVIALPTTFIVDPKGTITHVIPGFGSGFRKRVDRAVREGLGLPVPVEKPEATPEEKRAVRLIHLAETFLAKGRSDEAAAALRKACDLRPGDAALWNRLGRLHLRLRDTKAAAEAFGRARQASADDRTAQRGLLVAAALESPGNDTLAALRKALRKPPIDAEFHYHFGRALEAAGQPEEALKAYRKACEAFLRNR